MDISSPRRCVIYDDDAAYFSIVEEPLITHTAIDNVDQTEGEDLWVASTEYSVICICEKKIHIRLGKCYSI
jgi:hypothetical protein